MKRWAWLALPAILFALVLWFLWQPPAEPRYQGRSLSEWLLILDDGDNLEGFIWNPQPRSPLTQQQLEAADAIRHMGSRVTPVLLRMLKVKNSPLQKARNEVEDQVASIKAGRRSMIMRVTPASVVRHRAAMGLVALASSDRPSVSELTPILGERPIGKDAAYVLAGFGKEALQPLTAAMSQSPASRQAIYAAWALSRFPTNAQPVAGYLLRGLTNSANPGFQPACAYALYYVQTDPAVAVPALTNAATVWITGGEALRALGNYGPQAKAAVPFLTNLIRVQGPGVSREAVAALRAIDPQAAASVGAN
jgi:hypothetical protein